MLALKIPGIQLESELGRGISSVVYRARLGDVPCAVKFPRSKGRWTKWVHREAVALARVRHPALPRVLEVGNVDDRPFLVLELVHGDTLASRLERGPLAESVALGIAIELADALAAVHAVGLVHRDVKPKNILLEKGERVRLVDFGFATGLERAFGEGETPGTPRYAAPEQRRAPGLVDGRADLYALGLVLAEMLLARLPDDDMLEPMLRRVASPAAVDAIRRLTAARPDDRFPDAVALGAALRAARGMPAPLQPSSRDRASASLRGAALARLQRELREVGRRGGSLVAITGERGMGKSRLLRAAIQSARQGGQSARAVQAICEDLDPPLALVRRLVLGAIEALDTQLGCDEARTNAALRDAIPAALHPFSTLVAPELAARLDAKPLRVDANNDAFAEAAAEILGALFRRLAPALVCVDDAHRMDPSSRQVLVALADQLSATPVVLVLAARPGAAALAIEPVVVAARARAIALELAPLDAPALALLLEVYLDAAPPPDLVAYVGALGDGSVLGALEVLDASVDTGALRPHRGVWVFDLDAASAAALPRGATALLERRLAELAPATRRVLEAAAIHGRSWDTALLADLFGIGIADIGFAANDARRARLVETDASGAVRFVHDCVREALVDGLTEDARRELHQRCAEGLDRRGVVAFETLCVMAGHYAQGIATRTPDRAYHAHRTAADLALARAANEAAVGFLDVARTFAEAARLPLDAAFFEALGEAHLRTGALEASREAFQDALRRAAGAFHRARLFGRLAWVEQARSDATAAWTALSTAFDLLGASLPVESVSSAWGTTRALVLSRLATRGRPRSAEEAELLCQLHYQNGRLGVEYGRPARALQSMLAALVVSEPLGDAPPRARARATEGLLLTVLGRTEAGSRAVDDAHRIATELADPSLLAFCALSRATALTIAGELDAASDAIAECLRDRGHWIELGEYGLLAFTGDLIESVRGRSERALAFAQLALDRVRRRRRPDGIAPLAALRARAALAALGKDYEPDPWTDELLARSDRASWRKGIVGALSIAPRLRLVLEAGRTGDELEALVAELRQQARGPHRSAPALVEAFLYVVHARVDASFGAPASARASHAALVREATAELRDRARQPVMVAHIRFAEGHAAWLLGKRAESARLFAEAERIAVEDGIPWVLHAVARTRAHDLLARGARGAAAEQGRIAESIARAHGALPKARRVAHELGLGSHGARGTSAAHETSSSLSSETGRQLRSMVNLARSTRRSASLRDQAALVADEVLRLLDGERCCLLFHPERHAGGSGLCVAVDAALGASEPTVHERLRLEAATGVPAPREFGAQRGGPGGRVLVAPLFLFDQLVGAVSVELPPGAAASERAAGVLVAVAGQLPVALELARLLAEREQLQASLLQAQRMEAVGQLAGGIAHDFNNMLSAIVGSAESLSDHVNGHPEAMEELGVITTASMRAADLTKQLLSFSRHKPLPLKCLDANALVTSLVPMLQRIVGDRIEISVRLDATSYEVKSDASGLEQALVNLATNARDAMKREGKLLVRTRDVVLDDAASRRGAPAPGAYVAIDVVDAGEGMPRDVLERVFDPFFTTKPPGAGTGLGLTMVYTFVARSAGHVQLDSTPGAGTTVTLLLPRFEGPDEPVPAEPPSIPAIPRLGGPPRATILVVDDDVVVRASIKRTLQREGYVVIAAEGARDAERTLASHVDEIALVVLDVVMPDDSGPTLARRWKKELARPPKVLFVSGFSPETLPTPENGQVGARFLQKPFSGAELLARVTQLLGAGANAE